MGTMELSEAKKGAVETHQAVRQFLGKPKLNKDEEMQMLMQAYASLYLWGIAGTPLLVARGHWLVSRVACVLKEVRLASQHAQLCEFFTKQAVDKKDFDIAYSIESLARAAALKGDLDVARDLKEQARRLGAQIRDLGDKKGFQADFLSGPWFGLE